MLSVPRICFPLFFRRAAFPMNPNSFPTSTSYDRKTAFVSLLRVIRQHESQRSRDVSLEHDTVRIRQYSRTRWPPDNGVISLWGLRTKVGSARLQGWNYHLLALILVLVIDLAYPQSSLTRLLGFVVRSVGNLMHLARSTAAMLNLADQRSCSVESRLPQPQIVDLITTICIRSYIEGSHTFAV